MGEDKTLIHDTLRLQENSIRTDDFEIKNFEKDNLVQRVSKYGLVIIWKIKEID